MKPHPGFSPYAKKYAEAIWGRLAADSVASVSDADLATSLTPCVCGEMLVRAATELREAGLLLMVDGSVCCTLVPSALSWKLSDDAKARIAEIESHIVRPGDPRLDQIVCGPTPSLIRADRAPEVTKEK